MFNNKHKMPLLALFAFMLVISIPVWAKKQVCPDGKCNGGETAISCPADCAVTGFCGDGTCDADETDVSCPTDCAPPPPAVCVINGVCNAGEDCISCPSDCSGVTSGKPGNRYCCGADTCDTGLCGASCGSAILEYCGDGNIDSGEDCDDSGETASCDSNCTSVVCGDGTLNTTSGEECDDGNADPGDGCDATCKIESTSVHAPSNQFNIGDSIGEGEAANGTIGDPNHQTVWSTGYDTGDSVNSLNERFESTAPSDYYENSASRDSVFNHAVSGADMADFAAQANALVAAAQSSSPPDEAGMITILLGNNDVCAGSLAEMTDPADFETQYRAGLDVLAGSAQTRLANIHVSGIPAIYWLWNAKRNSFWCRVFAWPFVPCENLLDNPADDCANTASRLDPDMIYAGDGTNCQRRKTFHAEIRDTYNPKLQSVLQEYINNGSLPNASFIDVFDVQFEDSHINGGDCFHPSETGHALLSEEEWCNSQWGESDALCTP